jgi:hypothetical protein
MNQLLSLLKGLVFLVGMITLAPIALTVAGYFATVIEVLLRPALGALLGLTTSFLISPNLALSLTFS